MHYLSRFQLQLRGNNLKMISISPVNIHFLSGYSSFLVGLSLFGIPCLNMLYLLKLSALLCLVLKLSIYRDNNLSCMVKKVDLAPFFCILS